MEIYKAKFGAPERGGWVVLVHGLGGEHSGRYGKLISMLNDAALPFTPSTGPDTGRAEERGGDTPASKRLWK